MTTDAQVRDNAVSGFDMTAVQGGAVAVAYGISLGGPRTRASGNHVSNTGGTIGYGISASPGSDYCLDNTVGGFATNIDGNCISSGNLTSP